MKRFLIVGAGIGQLFLAKKIKERGDYLITVTLPGNQPVIDIADEVIYENVFDKENVLRKAAEANIDAVVSDQNDTMMPTVAYIAEKLGLPGNSIAAVNAYCNKNVFRDNCDRLGIPVPKHIAVHRGDNLHHDSFLCPFPWMVKPADSQSSLGVSKVNCEEELSGALSHAFHFSKTDTAIVEEFFEGRELVAEGFIYNGRYYNLGFADRKYFNLKSVFIPSQTLFPSLAPDAIKNRILDYESKMAKYVSPRFAIVHSEYLFNVQTGGIRVVESALRGGGVYISSHLIPLYSGIDINDVLLDCATGSSLDMDAIMSQRDEKAAGYVCFSLPEGQVKSISGMDEILKDPGVEMAELHGIDLGMKTLPMTHKGQRLGPILISADNREELDMRVQKIQSTIDITVVSADGSLHGINWS
ncbi:MAG: hypothetical protein J5374_10540 [Bacteroidales bacterium]|nr:hypothetical protein [Bacteroidales bacterium]